MPHQGLFISFACPTRHGKACSPRHTCIHVQYMYMYMYRTYMYRHQCTVRRWGSLITPTSAKAPPDREGYALVRGMKTKYIPVPLRLRNKFIGTDYRVTGNEKTKRNEALAGVSPSASAKIACSMGDRIHHCAPPRTPPPPPKKNCYFGACA
ncbi:hypothetical protein ACKS0A_11445 [Histoplasma ohiense]